MRTLFEMSLQGGVFIVAVAALRALMLNKLPKTAFITLWELAILRLLLPFGVFGASEQADTVVPSPVGSLPTVIVGGTAYNPAVTDIPTAQSGRQVDVIALIWCAGAVLVAAYLLVNYFRCRREFASAIPLEDSFVSDWQSRQRTKRVIKVKVTDAVSSPMTYGLLRPVILLPKNIDIKNTSQLRFILMHEYVHIKKLDGILKAVSSAALCVHWFNPLVWVMHRLLCRDIELRCDESVLKELGIDSRADYARAIIALEEQRSGLLPMGSGFARNPAKERIVAIMKYRDKTPISAVILTIVLVAVIAVTAVACAAKDDTDNIEKEKLDSSVNVQTDTEVFPIDGELDLKAEDTVMINMERDLSSPEYYTEDETIEFGYVLNGLTSVIASFDGSDPTKPLDERDGKADSVGLHFTAPEDGHYSFYISYSGDAKFTLVSASAEISGFTQYVPLNPFPAIDGVIVGDELREYMMTAGQTLHMLVFRDLSSPEYYADDEAIEFGYILNDEIVPVGAPFNGFDTDGKADYFEYHFEAPEDGTYRFYLSYKGDAEFRYTLIQIDMDGIPIKRIESDTAPSDDSYIPADMGRHLSVSYSDGKYLFNDGEAFKFKKGESARIIASRDVSSDKYYSENDYTELGYILNGEAVVLTYDNGVPYGVEYGTSNRIVDFEAPEDGEYTFYVTYSGDAEFKINHVVVNRNLSPVNATASDAE